MSAGSIADAALVGQLTMLELAKPGIVQSEFSGVANWYEKLRS